MIFENTDNWKEKLNIQFITDLPEPDEPNPFPGLL